MGVGVDASVGVATHDSAPQGTAYSAMGKTNGEVAVGASGDIGCAVVFDVGFYRSPGYVGQLEFDLGIATVALAGDPSGKSGTLARGAACGACIDHSVVFVAFTVCSSIRIFN